MKQSNLRISFMPIASLLLISACSSSSTNSTNAVDSTEANQSSNTGSMVPTEQLPAGNISHFGAVSIADEQGEISDLIGGFFELSNGVDEAYFASLAAPENTNCYVDSDDNIDFEEISASYIPSLKGVGKTSISAGEFVHINAGGSGYAELAQQPAGAFLFYDLAPGQMTPPGPVPLSLSVDVPGNDYPGFSSVPVPTVSALENFTLSSGTNVNSNTVFTWKAEPNSTAQVRIFTSTAGGFFLEDGMTVSCIVPDTGEFIFPASVKEQIGDDFSGASPIVSRIQTHIENSDNTVLFVIRESFYQ